MFALRMCVGSDFLLLWPVVSLQHNAQRVPVPPSSEPEVAACCLQQSEERSQPS